MSRKTIAHILLFFVNLFYGANFIVSKLIMPVYILPQAIILIRVAVTVVAFFIVGHYWGRERVAARDYPLLLLCGLLGVVINQELFFAGLNLTTPINGALLMIMTPILIMVVSFFTGHESLTWQKALGLVLGTLGAFIILSGRGLSFSSATAYGDFLILLNASSYAIYLVVVRPLMKKYHPMTVIKWVFLMGLPFVILLGIPQLRAVEWHTFTPQAWASLIFIIVCVTFCAYLFNIIALREVHSSVVGAYIYLQPILATLLAYLIGKDSLSIEKIIAAVLIFMGVYFVSFTDRRQPVMPIEE